MENENQKKMVHLQSKEIERLQHLLNMANDKVRRLQKKVLSYHHMVVKEDIEFKVEKGKSIAFTDIPTSFDFRKHYLSPEFKSTFKF